MISRLVAAVLFTAFVGSFASAEEADYILFHKPENQPLIDSKFGPIADFQRALLNEAKNCGLSTSVTNQFTIGIFGTGSAAVARKVATCRHLALSDPSGQTITASMWHTIAAGIEVPAARRRARAMSFKFEGTDYDKIEWNVGTRDDGIITWGPLGATAGQAFQVQRILANIDHAYPDLIAASFGSEAESVRGFTTKRSTASATTFVWDIVKDRKRQTLWSKGFQSLGYDKRARDLYDALMDASSTAGIPEAIADFTRGYWKRCWIPTEVDYGFFFDRAVQINVTDALAEGGNSDRRKLMAATDSILRETRWPPWGVGEMEI